MACLARLLLLVAWAAAHRHHRADARRDPAEGEALHVVRADGAAAAVAVEGAAARGWSTWPTEDPWLLERAGVFAEAARGRVCFIDTGGRGPGAMPTPAAKEKFVPKASGAGEDASVLGPSWVAASKEGIVVERKDVMHWKARPGDPKFWTRGMRMRYDDVVATKGRPWVVRCDDDAKHVPTTLGDVQRIVIGAGLPRSGTSWWVQHFVIGRSQGVGANGVSGRVAVRLETNWLARGEDLARYAQLFPEKHPAVMVQKGLWSVGEPMLPWKVRAILATRAAGREDVVKVALLVRREGARWESARRKFGKSGTGMPPASERAWREWRECAAKAYAGVAPEGTEIPQEAFPSRAWYCMLWRLPLDALYRADAQVNAECMSGGGDAHEMLQKNSRKVWPLWALRWTKVLGEQNVMLIPYDAAVGNHSRYLRALEDFTGVGPLNHLPPPDESVKKARAPPSAVDDAWAKVAGIAETDVRFGQPPARLWCPAAAV